MTAPDRVISSTQLVVTDPHRTAHIERPNPLDIAGYLSGWFSITVPILAYEFDRKGPGFDRCPESVGGNISWKYWELHVSQRRH